jgi:hypothetical protein
MTRTEAAQALNTRFGANNWALTTDPQTKRGVVTELGAEFEFFDVSAVVLDEVAGTYSPSVRRISVLHRRSAGAQDGFFLPIGWDS